MRRLFVVAFALSICTSLTLAGPDQSSNSNIGKMSKRPTASMVTPPDPCSKFKQRVAHERCVTRQMNMDAVHGGQNSTTHAMSNYNEMRSGQKPQ